MQVLHFALMAGVLMFAGVVGFLTEASEDPSDPVSAGGNSDFEVLTWVAAGLIVASLTTAFASRARFFRLCSETEDDAAAIRMFATGSLIFAAVLMYSAYGMVQSLGKDDDDEDDLSQNRVVRCVKLGR